MTPSEHIDQQIASYPDWRGETLAKLRQLIHQADPDITEEWKWDTGVWTHNGLVCAASAFREHVKLNFFKGARLEDPDKLFNNGFTSKQHRAIDFTQSDTLAETEIINLIRSAIALNK